MQKVVGSSPIIRFFGKLNPATAHIRDRQGDQGQRDDERCSEEGRDAHQGARRNAMSSSHSGQIAPLSRVGATLS